VEHGGVSKEERGKGTRGMPWSRSIQIRISPRFSKPKFTTLTHPTRMSKVLLGGPPQQTCHPNAGMAPPRCSLVDCRRQETRVWDGSARRISRRASSTRAWRAPADAAPVVPAPNVCMYSVLPPSVGATHKKQKNNPSHAGRGTSESSRAATPTATALLAPSARAPQPLA